jgi:RNA polymerase sigma-70 factor (ECF subfamily)
VGAVVCARVGWRGPLEDMVQETFTRAWRELARLEDAAQFPAWLRGIALRACADWHRRRGREPRGTADVTELDPPAREPVADEEARALLAAVEALPEIYRETLTLYHFGERSHAEIAATLGLTPAGVNARLGKARAAARELDEEPMSTAPVERLSAYLEGTLAPEERVALEAELAARPELAAELAALERQKRALARAFAPLRARVDGLPSTRAFERDARTTLARRPWPWLLVGVAAGTLVTGSLLRWGAAPRVDAPSGAPRPATLARLEHALGPVEGESGRALATGAELAPGARLVTPAGSRCTLVLSEGTRVRVDAESELVLRAARRIELVRGRIYADVARDGTHFLAVAGASPVEVLGTRIDLALVRETPPDAPARERAELVVLEGRALLCGTPVEAGQRALALDGRFEHAEEARDLLVATSWVNELLAFEPEHTSEFQARVDALLAMLGQTKMEHLYEWEIRSLGDHCALPLLRYVESPGSCDTPHRRHDAVRILADVATRAQLDGLLGLLADADPEIRVTAARAILRLTGRPLGEPEDLRVDDFARVAEAWRAAQSLR